MSQKKNKIDFRDVTFLIPVRIDSNSRLQNLNTIISYLDKFLFTKIIILESDSIQRVDSRDIPEICSYHFINDCNNILHRTRLINMLVELAETQFIAIYDTDVVFPIRQLVSSLTLLRTGKCDMVFPYQGEFINVDHLGKLQFMTDLDPEKLTLNKQQYTKIMERSLGGAFIVDKNIYKKAGKENENFTSWGMEDLERVKRMKILGYTINRIRGSLFHLPHARLINSTYPDIETRNNLITEFLIISSMDKAQLQAYIKTWPWNTSTKKNGRSSFGFLYITTEFALLLREYVRGIKSSSFFTGVGGVSLLYYSLYPYCPLLKSLWLSLAKKYIDRSDIFDHESFNMGYRGVGWMSNWLKKQGNSNEDLIHLADICDQHFYNIVLYRSCPENIGFDKGVLGYLAYFGNRQLDNGNLTLNQLLLKEAFVIITDDLNDWLPNTIAANSFIENEYEDLGLLAVYLSRSLSWQVNTPVIKQIFITVMKALENYIMASELLYNNDIFDFNSNHHKTFHLILCYYFASSITPDYNTNHTAYKFVDSSLFVSLFEFALTSGMIYKYHIWHIGTNTIKSQFRLRRRFLDLFSKCQLNSISFNWDHEILPYIVKTSIVLNSN